tara:strand:- start:196 stop:591 length:396 start_codon:yes stop_codon:yes gene_type:complete
MRKLTESDYEALCEWWKAWKWPPVEKDFLPDNGTGGYVIEKDGVMIVAGFVYITNSKVALLEWIISNPEYRETDRDMAITCLIKAIETLIKDWGYKYVFSVGRTKALIERHKKLGYHVDETTSHEIVKILN